MLNDVLVIIPSRLVLVMGCNPLGVLFVSLLGVLSYLNVNIVDVFHLVWFIMSQVMMTTTTTPPATCVLWSILITMTFTLAPTLGQIPSGQQGVVLLP